MALSPIMVNISSYGKASLHVNIKLDNVVDISFRMASRSDSDDFIV